MSARQPPLPLIELDGIAKSFGASDPLRIGHLAMAPTDRIVLSGVGPHAAEMLIHLICGAMLPDEGSIRIAGVKTSEVVTDRDWLQSLDRFGLVTHRSALIGTLSTLANLALPLTVAIEPMAPTTRAEVEAVGRLVELGSDRLLATVSTLTSFERVRLHLGRAVIARPTFVLLEDPTSSLGNPAERAQFGRLLRAVADARRHGWVAVSDDDVFAKATGATRLRLDRRSGAISRVRGWWPFPGASHRARSG